ncbi:hypothetical protein PAUR_a2696 [Pseudoalteromonas aurantia 208]|uniref:Uncharacterized protein n=1 Tax=Pseudoalteromonas aurantia 208 TaxID=1314867 RepID=A0ABR9ED95_9GAMM|nr:hypothetical protein [Pseudoalteromonas aurantia 208]
MIYKTHANLHISNDRVYICEREFITPMRNTTKVLIGASH